MQYIHETLLRDIVDILSDVKDIDQFEVYLNRHRRGSMKSVASGSSALTMVFPVLTTNTISLNAAETISKAIETKAVEMLQIVMASLQMTHTQDLQDYISQFHSNLDKELSMDNILQTVDKVVNLAESVGFKKQPDVCLLSEKECELLCKKDLRNVNGLPLGDINMDSISIYKIKETYNDYNIIKEAINPGDVTQRFTNAASGMKNLVDMQHKTLPTINNNNVDKANDLVGTQLVVTVNYCDKANGVTIPLSFLVSVKAKLYVLESADIVEKLVSKNRDKNFFNKVVKMFTREISFFNDFVFAIDKAKADAKSHSIVNRTSSKLWKVLERRSSKSKIHRALGTKNSAMAITTLVISKDEVEHINKYYNIDMEQSKITRQLMEAYNLLAMVIADEVNETASFLFDTGDDEFETISFAGLEKQTKEGPYRKALQLMVTSNK